MKAKFVRSRGAVAAWSVLGFLGLATIIRNVLSWNGWFNAILLGAVVTDPKTSQMTVKGWIFWVFALLVSTAVCVTALLVRSEINLQTALKTRDERKTIAFKTMQGMMVAATRIRDQHHPSATKVKKSVRRVELTFRIHENFDTNVEQKWDIYSSQEPVSFWTTSVQATSEANPMEYLDDIDFKMRDDSGNGVVYLPVENDPRCKKVMLYFLPQIEPGQADRKIVFTYSWPGLFNQLKTKTTEPFTWSTESVSPIEQLRFSFYLEKGKGYELAHQNIGPKYEKIKPEKISDGDQWSGFAYTIEDVPAGKCRVVLNLKLQKA